MTDFRAKMHQIRFRLGLRPDPAEELTALHRPLARFGGRFAAGGGAGLGKRRKGGGEGEGMEGEVEGRREGPKLLLNQGPLEPCYATAPLSQAAR